MVTIQSVVMEEIEDGKNKPVVYFNPTAGLPGHEKPAMVLNLINSNMVKSAYGNNTDAWIGKSVGLWVDPNVQFGGKIVKGLRLKVVQAEPQFNADPVQFDPPIADGTSEPPPGFEDAPPGLDEPAF